MVVKNFLILIVFGFIVGSCSRCKTCTSGSTLVPLESTICREDFDNGSEYRDAIKDLEEYGWECN